TPTLTADSLQLYELTTVLPRALLIENVRVIPDRDAIFEAMRETTFDPRREVILERQPGIKTSPPADGSPPGTVTVRDQSTDETRIEAELTRPAVLVLTDAYHSGWRAEPADGSSQASHEVIPANYVLRAIPLQAGSHHIRLEYRPTSFRVGLWVSIIAALAYLAAWAFVWRRRRVRE
ncbi:MAG: YfhO family protein, partial [Phycisphaerales bacterium]